MNKEQLINKFNTRFPVGSKCPIRTINHAKVPFVEHVVTHKAYDLHGQPVAFFEGKSGCISIEPGFVDYSEKAETKVAA